MIILLGFPKSGTSSFHKLFNDLGYKSIDCTGIAVSVPAFVTPG